MNKIIFEVFSQKPFSTHNLTEEIRNISYKIHINVTKNIVQVENAPNYAFSELIDCLNKYFTILSITLDNRPTCPIVSVKFESEPEHKTVVKLARVVSPARVNKKLNSSSMGKHEETLVNLFSSAFAGLERPYPIKYKVNYFLSDIGMITASLEIRQAFIIATDVNGITYANIIDSVHKLYPNTSRDELENLFQRAFKNWLQKYPQLKETNRGISFMHLLRAFSKYNSKYKIKS